MLAAATKTNNFSPWKYYTRSRKDQSSHLVLHELRSWQTPLQEKQDIFPPKANLSAGYEATKRL